MIRITTCARSSTKTTTAAERLMQQMTEIRERRKKATETEEIVTLGQEGPNFVRQFWDELAAVVSQNDSSVKCYKIAVNSLREAFLRRRLTRSMGAGSADDMAKKRMIKFLGEDLEAGVEESVKPVENSPSKQVMMHEIRCLFELHLLRLYPRPLIETKVARSVLQLYLISTPMRTKRFLDESICDEFIEDLPFFLAQLYDELEMPMPFDLHPYRAHARRETPLPCLLPPKAKLEAKLEELFKLERPDV